jgi:hypothetical protein
MKKSTTTILELTPPSRAKTVGDRIREIEPYEILILFVLVVLLALCIVVAQVVVQGVDTNANPAPDSPEYYRHEVSDPAGLNAASEWGF